MRVEECETKLELGTPGSPGTLENQIEAEDGDKKIIYRGSIKNLEFSSDGVRGEAQLMKVRAAESDRWMEEGLCWIAAANGGVIVKNGDSFSYPLVGDSSGYKTKIRYNAAANRGVVLSSALLEAVFSPIDEKIMKAYAAFLNVR